MWPFSKKEQPKTDYSKQQPKDDPFFRVKIGAKDVFQRLLKAMQDDKGVHIESLLCVLGSLAGYSCQASVRESFVTQRGLRENEAFVIVECKDGRRYFFGDRLNKLVAEDNCSVWSLAAGAAQHQGAKELIDLNEIFQHVSLTVGGEQFGKLRLSEGHNTSDAPINYVKALWPVMLPIVQSYCQPEQWPMLFGLAIQECMIFGKSVIDPNMALSIVMESAISMSKVDLQQA